MTLLARLLSTLAISLALLPATALAQVYVFQVPQQGIVPLAPPEPPSLVVSAGMLDFGTVNNLATKDLPVILTNTGGDAALGPVMIAAPFSLAESTCGERLAKQASCTLTVRFTPQEAVVSIAALAVSAGEGVSASVTLQGTGRVANYTVALANGQAAWLPAGATNQTLSYAYSGSGSNSQTLRRDGANVITTSGTSGGGSGTYNYAHLVPGHSYSFHFSSSTQTLTSLVLSYRR